MSNACDIAEKVEPQNPKQDAKSRMDELLAGKIKPENEFIEYALGKMRECLANKRAVVTQLKQAEQVVRQLEIRLVELGAEFDKYGTDVAHFDTVLQTLEGE